MGITVGVLALSRSRVHISLTQTPGLGLSFNMRRCAIGIALHLSYVRTWIVMGDITKKQRGYVRRWRFSPVSTTAGRGAGRRKAR